MNYLTFPGGNILSQLIPFTRMLPFESAQYYTEYSYTGTWPKLNGSPVSSCEPESCCIMGKKCKCLGDSASQYANALESVLEQINHITQSVATELSDLKYRGLIFLVENLKEKKVLGKQKLLMFVESLLPSERNDRKFPD